MTGWNSAVESTEWIAQSLGTQSHTLFTRTARDHAVGVSIFQFGGSLQIIKVIVSRNSISCRERWWQAGIYLVGQTVTRTK